MEVRRVQESEYTCESIFSLSHSHSDFRQFALFAEYSHRFENIGTDLKLLKNRLLSPSIYSVLCITKKHSAF